MSPRITIRKETFDRLKLHAGKFASKWIADPEPGSSESFVIIRVSERNYERLRNFRDETRSASFDDALNLVIDKVLEREIL